MDFTFICTTEILAFSDAHFQALDTVALGVSVDSHYAWANQPRKEGGLGSDLKLVLIAYRNRKISGDGTTVNVSSAAFTVVKVASEDEYTRG
ncbi:hypothetical protein D9758_016203 [Tetrapyrgos nigripes]|uniref:Alkyl hydroperoxide reductase subunit C/ Thiol specific antioxidant domain-containing protein n=1 Tax=Tetrapyrgos nigripes TaxID=182062 RepID=A0A8H5FNZ9_9AGAR|nr:hypothetical protein D9758_016203 [Tetrapyrgos nigripes]